MTENKNKSATATEQRRNRTVRFASFARSHCNRLINGAPFGERLEIECMTIASFRLTCSDSSKPTQVSLLSLDQADSG
ncbi:MAG: hypothetical protein C5B58_05475 [Acidobacteria bacterium]|nr:MAG: hypothetical protein C5B58_05475 [Acidobacteriota bacterium]